MKLEDSVAVVPISHQRPYFFTASFKFFKVAIGLTALLLTSVIWIGLSQYHSSGSNFPDLYEASILELKSGLDAGHFLSVDLVRAYFARIDEVNLRGASLRAVLELNPSAIAEAQRLDDERRTSGPRSLLHGIPVLLKDSLATLASDGMNTTAGSFALLNSIVPEDAGVVKRLRAAGAILLGKSTLTEWAHFRFNGDFASGWSARGGQSKNPYYPDADPCSSSSGSAIATAIGLTAVSLGTETDGSITCPASHNNLVGVKPTVGLTSRAGVIPVTEQQDTVGPMTRSVTDAAIVLSIIAGPDPNDNFTLAQPSPMPNFLSALRKDALEGVRVGVPRKVFLNNSLTDIDPSVTIAFNRALATIRSMGATIVDPADLPSAEEIIHSRNETLVAAIDFKIQINAYFSGLKTNPSHVASLTELIAFNDAHPDLEKPVNFTDQSSLIESEQTNGRNTSYFESLAFNKELGATRGIDSALQTHNLSALLLPAPGWTSAPAAIAGYPIVTVPLGFYPDSVVVRRSGPLTLYPAPGVPFGLSFIGTAFSEIELLSFAFAYEQSTKTRMGRRAFIEAIPKTQLVDIVSAK